MADAGDSVTQTVSQTVSSVWHYMVSGAIVIEEVGQPLRIIDRPAQEDGHIAFQLRTNGPAMPDPPMRLATHDENVRWSLERSL
jgi:hypothetical protein